MNRLMLIPAFLIIAFVFCTSNNGVVVNGGGTEITGWIHATALLEKSSFRQGIDVYIPGTSFCGKSDSSGSIIFLHVPPGKYEIRFEHNGYISLSDSACVLAGFTDSIGPVKLSPNPVPTGLTAKIDSTLGTVTLTWENSVKKIKGFNVRIVDTLVDRYPEDGRIRYTTDNVFTDTVFTENKVDKNSGKFRIYQVCLIDEKGNRGQWGSACSVFVKKPVIPPVPSCSLFNKTGSLTVSLFTSIPQLWWIDSLIIFRSINSDLIVCAARLPVRSNQCWNDNLNAIPVVKDSSVPVTYTVFTKSVYGFLSFQACTASIAINNPYQTYSIETPPKPLGLLSVVKAGVYAVGIARGKSPVSNDTTEYRLIIKNDLDTAVVYTEWYTIPLIEVSLQQKSRYYLQCQIRSRRLPGLQSQLSDICTVSVYKENVISKPTTPAGKSLVIHSNPYTYKSNCSDTCWTGDKIAIRYVLSYQGEIAVDSTEWLPVPDHTATVLWSKPGIAYLRAQARCIDNPFIISPWSDALVVKVE